MPSEQVIATDWIDQPHNLAQSKLQERISQTI
jgi:hypothetical protein